MSTARPPAWLAALVDDARPGASGSVGVLAGSPWSTEAAAMRALVVPDTLVGTLADDVPAVPVVLHVTAGAGAIGPALAHASRIDGLALVGLRTNLRDEDDLARNAERVVRVLDGELPDGVAASVGMPDRSAPTPDWLAAADVVAAAEHGLALHPAPAALDAALDRECPITVRHVRDPGVARLALATVRALWDAEPADLADPAEVRAWGDDVSAAVRRRVVALESEAPGPLVQGLLGDVA